MKKKTEAGSERELTGARDWETIRRIGFLSRRRGIWFWEGMAGWCVRWWNGELRREREGREGGEREREARIAVWYTTRVGVAGATV